MDEEESTDWESKCVKQKASRGLKSGDRQEILSQRRHTIDKCQKGFSVVREIEPTTLGKLNVFSITGTSTNIQCPSKSGLEES